MPCRWDHSLGWFKLFSSTRLAFWINKSIIHRISERSLINGELHFNAWWVFKRWISYWIAGFTSLLSKNNSWFKTNFLYPAQKITIRNFRLIWLDDPLIQLCFLCSWRKYSDKGGEVITENSKRILQGYPKLKLNISRLHVYSKSSHRHVVSTRTIW